MRTIDAASCGNLTDILRTHPAVLFLNGNTARLGVINRAAIETVKASAPEVELYDVSRNRSVRRQVMDTSFWDSFPQLFVNGEFIGGYPVIKEFFRSGEYGRVRHGRDPAAAAPSPMVESQQHDTASLWRMDCAGGARVLLAASAAGAIEIVDAETLEAHRLLISNGWVNAALKLEDGLVAAGLSDATIRVVDLATGHQVRTLQGHGRWVNDLARGRDGRFFSVSADGRLAAWSTHSEHPLQSVVAHDSCIWSVAVNDSGSVVATSAAAGDVKLWRSESLEPIGAAVIDARCVTDVCWAGHRLIAATYSGDVYVLSSDLSESARLEGHRERVWTIAVLETSGRCATASGDGTVRLWDLEIGCELARRSFESMPISTAYVSALGALAVGHEDGGITWHDVREGTLAPMSGRRCHG